MRVAARSEVGKEAATSAPPRIELFDPEINRPITATASPDPIPTITAIRSNRKDFPQLGPALIIMRRWDVGFREQTGKHLLTSRFSGFDPKRKSSGRFC